MVAGDKDTVATVLSRYDYRDVAVCADGYARMVKMRLALRYVTRSRYAVAICYGDKMEDRVRRLSGIETYIEGESLNESLFTTMLR